MGAVIVVVAGAVVVVAGAVVEEGRFGTERRIVVTHSDDLHQSSPRASTRPWPRPGVSSQSLPTASAEARPASPKEKVEAEIAES